MHVDRLKLVEGPTDTSWFTGERDTPGEVRHEPPGDPRQHVDMLDSGDHN